MKRTFLILAVALALSGCKSEAEKRAEFLRFCSTHGFGSDQCEVLYALRKDIADDQANTESNGVTTGILIGTGIGSGSGRK